MEYRYVYLLKFTNYLSHIKINIVEIYYIIKNF